jgi:diguanylate cyclase (GGDEF)-like protein
VVIHGAQQGQRFFINKPEMYIGRDATVEIRIQEACISRRHAALACRDGAVTLADNDSSNGTFVNGARLTPGVAVTLAKEDRIQLGNAIVKFLPAGDLEILTFGQMDEAANTDALTGIFNKRYLLEALDGHVARARTLASPYAVVFCDLDHFKAVNDTHGHDAGDAVLQEFSRLIKTRFVRHSDVFARFGGEEFVVLLPGTDGEGAARVAERIRGAVASHLFTYGPRALAVTVSIGVAEWRGDTDAGDLLRRADKAMYASKDRGRNRVTIAD